MKLPERLYYPISLAAEKLSCTVADLIHFGASSQIEVCYMMKEAFAEGVVIKGIGSDAIILSGLYGILQIGMELNNNEYRFGQRHAFCFGLFSLNSNTLRDWDMPFLEVSSPSTEFKTPLHSMKEQISLSLPIDVIMNTSRLYITAHEMGRIINKPFTPPTRMSVFTTNSTESTRKPNENKQARLIKALLRIQYGETFANNPRSLLEDNGELLNDLANLGIRPPVSGKTLNTWLEDIELEYTEISS